MDSEPPLIKKQSFEVDSPLFNNDSDNLLSDEEDPYSFTSTSTSLIGLAIVILMLGIPLLAVINERSASEKSIIPRSLEQNGLKSPSSFTISWISQSSR